VHLRYGSAGMARRLILAALGAAVLAMPSGAGAMGAAQLPSTTASSPHGPGTGDGEAANPINDQGSSFDYRSNITTIAPSVPGLSVEVLEFADRLLLRNRTGKTVTIYGYEGEPYARVLANGTAEQNVRAPATYLNTNFYANVTVPPSASSRASPQWEVVDRTGQFEWHDHRIHWMSPVPPASVKDKGRRTLIFDWKVPIAVGTSKGAIDGQLFWTPDDSKAPLALIILGVVIVIAGLVLVAVVRRRRARGAGAGGAPGAAAGVGAAPKEAW
jgi:hypothetical protein